MELLMTSEVVIHQHVEISLGGHELDEFDS
jgi:hypothetical protein